MPLKANSAPQADPAPIFEIFRGSLGTELLVAAIAHFNVFEILSADPVAPDKLREKIGLAERPAAVLFTALRAFGLVSADKAGRLLLTGMAREHLVPGAPFDVSDYVSLTRDNPGVLEIVARLKSNKPAGSDKPATKKSGSGMPPKKSGVAFIYRKGMDSAMEEEAAARKLTLALAGRAKNCAPVLAQKVDLRKTRVLLDAGGGTGIYSIACLQQYPALRAIVWDRPEVLKVAAEMAAAYGVANRLECRPGDMFADPVPEGVDAILLSNILHDWDIPECRTLVRRCADALPSSGKLLIHDAFLNDAQDGPVAVALYSAALFGLTEGRAYSGAEYREWVTEAGLKPSKAVDTLVHCSVLTSLKK